MPKLVFLLAHIYPQHRILAHSLLTISAITAQPFRRSDRKSDHADYEPSGQWLWSLRVSAQNG
jgi:hypothetical protein